MTSRRTFLLGTAAAVGCSRGQARVGCDLPGTLVGRCVLVGEPAPSSFETASGTGLDERYTVDLASLDAGSLVLPADRFYVRTGEPEGLGDGVGWVVRLTGRVIAPVDVLAADLQAAAVPIGVRHFECSGNADASRFGLMSAGDFSGVPFPDVLAQVQPDATAAFVRVCGLDQHPPSAQSVVGAGWVFDPADLDDAWLVTHLDGALLPRDHGFPVRLLVPNWYGCSNIKWVDEIAWVPDDEPATSQMTEFASRTNQDGVPELARAYAPATADTAALVTRVERWSVDGAEVLRATGLVWGGDRVPDRLRLLADGVEVAQPTMCTSRDGVHTWALWEAELPDSLSGEVTFGLKADGVPTLRLDEGYYDRTFDVDTLEA